MPANAKTCGRDFGLSVRMLVTLLLVGGVYAGSIFVFLRVVVPLFVNTGGALLLPLAVAGTVAAVLIGSNPLRAVHARAVGPDEQPVLHELLDRLCVQADVPKPQLALVESAVANSFTTGFTPGTSTIAVTRALLDKLGPQELEAVLAHELSHVVNRDGAVMSFVAVPATASGAVWRFLGKRSPLLWLLLWAYVLFVKLYAGFTNTLLLVLSRYREYAADRGAALLTGAPEQLMSALQKLSVPGALIPSTDLREIDGIGCLCIVDSTGQPTHPPVGARLARLAAIARSLGHEVPPTDESPDGPVDSGLFALLPYALLAAFVAGAWVYAHSLVGSV